MRTIILNFVNIPPFLRKPLWRLWHNWLISWEKRNVVMRFMNYGYAPLEWPPEMFSLSNQDEPERYCTQLYHYAVSHTDLRDKNVLEVGSGRGGGASYIARCLGPKSYIGLDLSERGTEFCNMYYDTPNLEFVRGEAEKLPFEANSFDVVVNVESSRVYGDIERFFREVLRVLKPGGDFLLTDMRLRDEVNNLHRQVQDAGFRVEKYHNITKNVVHALDIDDERKKHLIRKRVPGPLLKMFGEFAGLRGSGRYTSFASGAMQYVSYLLVKPDES